MRLRLIALLCLLATPALAQMQYQPGALGPAGGNYVGPVGLASYTVATLPACSATLKGSIAYVTDATLPAYNAALTGGGAVVVPVFCNGTAWTSH